MPVGRSRSEEVIQMAIGDSGVSPLTAWVALNGRLCRMVPAPAQALNLRR